MALYLVQHGKSLSKDVDPQQGLSEEGRADVDRIAAVARNYGIRVAEIVHSGKQRASQTAEIFASAFDIPDKVTAVSGLKPLDDVAVFAETVNTDDDMMTVGHLPFMEKLTAYLVAGDAEKTVFKFQNGGIVCLEKGVDNRAWYIKWTLMPKIG
jgi:phosphohistidine phosphatase